MDTCKLTELCRIQYGYAFDSASFTEDASFPPLVRIRDVKRGFSETYYSGNYSEEYIVRRGDILIGMDGEFNIARWQSEPALLNQRVCKIIPNQQIDGSYLLFALTKILKKIEDKTAFVTVKHLSAKELNKIELRIPNYEQQMQISSTLEKTLSIISRRQYQLAKLDELVKCRFVELFGDPVANDKGWPIVRLDAIADIRIGPFGSLLHKEDYQSGNHALVNPSHIVEGKIKVDSTLSVSNDKYNELSAYWLNPGDIVMGRRGEMGRCAVVEHSGLICGTGSLIIRTHGQMKPYFLQNILSRPEYKKIIEVKAVGVTMMNLNVPIVSSLEVPLLPHEQQIEFLGFTHRIDKLRIVIQQSLDEAQKLFDSLMQEYFD